MHYSSESFLATYQRPDTQALLRSGCTDRPPHDREMVCLWLTRAAQRGIKLTLQEIALIEELQQHVDPAIIASCKSDKI